MFEALVLHLSPASCFQNLLMLVTIDFVACLYWYQRLHDLGWLPPLGLNLLDRLFDLLSCRLSLMKLLEVGQLGEHYLLKLFCWRSSLHNLPLLLPFEQLIMSGRRPAFNRYQQLLLYFLHCPFAWHLSPEPFTGPILGLILQKKRLLPLHHLGPLALKSNFAIVRLPMLIAATLIIVDTHEQITLAIAGSSFADWLRLTCFVIIDIASFATCSYP